MSGKTTPAFNAGKTTPSAQNSDIYGGQSDDFTIAGHKLLHYNGKSERVIIPDGVTDISAEAFKNCAFIKSLVMPASVKLIKEDAFFGCKGLAKLEYLGTLRDFCGIDYKNGYAGPLWFARKLYIGGEQIKDLVIPEGLKTLKYDAFAGGVFNSITLPQGFEEVGWGSFCNNGNLKKITLPSSVKKIADWAYYYTGVREFIAPETLTYIGGNAFNSCKDMVCAFLPDTLEYVGERAFFGCKNVTVYCEAPCKPSGWHNDWAVLDEEGNTVKIIWNA